MRGVWIVTTEALLKQAIMNERKKQLSQIKRFDHGSWVKHSDKRAHQSKKCEDCFINQGVK